MRISLILLLVLFTGAGLPAAQSRAVAPSARAAVASIVVTTRGGKIWRGSGFFVSADGRMLTCYHVIQDATLISVELQSGEKYSDIEVTAIAPESDLALLSVRGVRNVAFLSVSRAEPVTFWREPLEIYAHPSVVPNQRLDAKLTRDSYAISDEFRMKSGARVFRRRGVKVLPLQMFAYNGISGGPLLLRDAAVAVVLGSYDEGGSIGWAMPIAASDKMTFVRQRPRDIQNWPPLDLMGDASISTLRKEVNIGTLLADALNEYGAAVDYFATVAAAWDALIREMLPNLQRAHDRIAAEVRARGRNFIVAGNPRLEALVDTPFDAATMTRFETMFSRSASAGTRYDKAEERLHDELYNYFDRLPNISATKRLRERVEADLNRSAEKFNTWLEQVDPTPDLKPVSTTLGDYLDDSQAVLRRARASIDYDTVSATVTARRTMQEIIEQLLEQATRLPALRN